MLLANLKILFYSYTFMITSPCHFDSTCKGKDIYELQEQTKITPVDAFPLRKACLLSTWIKLTHHQYLQKEKWRKPNLIKICVRAQNYMRIN
jgi:hypothetical protein